MSQFSPESSANRDQVFYLKKVTHEARERLASRLLLERLGVMVNKTPLGGTEGLLPLTIYFNIACEGFFYNARGDMYANEEGRKVLEDFLKISDKRGALNEVSDMGFTPPPPHVESLDRENQLAAFRHTLATIGFLYEQVQVSLASLKVPGYDWSTTVSFWNDRLSWEKVWGILGEVREASWEMIYAPYRLPRVREVLPQKYLRAAHFFAAGEKLLEDASNE